MGQFSAENSRSPGQILAEINTRRQELPRSLPHSDEGRRKPSADCENAIALELFAAVRSLCESPITCDKSLQHRGDEFRRLSRLARFLRKNLCISDKIPMQRGWQRDGELYRPVVVDRGEFQLGHRSFRFAVIVVRS